jgi:hypothetical protein
MTISGFARLLSRGAVLARDVNAVKRGRVPERIVNRAMAKGLGALMRGVWR